ncbi:proline--tRNA ligase [Rubinisphaera italica]|uniref:Proline--tRNA ligase n=1 Tax=Rubinisphaera italica TaxID=2527969 RepID=A0A5C5XFX4_9PLAN|nr:proline--tRNA ligase [Rubinisphaera italica]TWT61291.1 Proline--tRNA ligase [Rubinisphaera italica]
MRWSQSLIPTMKEVPADAEIPSHQLMLRAGLIRQLMAGAYTYLPLGWRSVQKAAQIIREEMEAAGAVELHMPALQPIELFDRTGRNEAFGSVLVRLDVTRGDRKVHMALGPTHEEVVTDLISRHINSYRQLPLTLYQIQTKFRNEERPRFGVLRTSEFLMKDAYSFASTLDQLNTSYDAMYAAYCRIFQRCGLKYIPVEAESGPIGGDASHEFMIPAENGEDQIVYCESSGYAANLERAETGRKTPDLSGSNSSAALEKVYTPKAGSIEAVCKFLKCSPEQMIKTLIYVADEKPVTVLLRGDHDANEGKIRRALGAKSLELADEKTIQSVTNAGIGFAGPVGIKCDVIADHDVPLITDAISGANETDQHYKNVNLGRDYQLETTYDLRDACEGDPCPKSGEPMKFVHGIEVGHVFKLGTKYSESLGAEFLNEHEKREPIIMGCYGIGVNRIVAGLAETCHDKNGLLWPISIAPYEVLIIPLKTDDEELMKIAEKMYADLKGQGVDVLFDDRPARPGVKFKDADLIGIPFRIVIGGKGLQEGIAEVKARTAEGPEKIPLDQTVEYVSKLVKEAKAELLAPSAT